MQRIMSLIICALWIFSASANDEQSAIEVQNKTGADVLVGFSFDEQFNNASMAGWQKYSKSVEPSPLLLKRTGHFVLYLTFIALRPGGITYAHPVSSSGTISDSGEHCLLLEHVTDAELKRILQQLPKSEHPRCGDKGAGLNLWSITIYPNTNERIVLKLGK